MGRTNRKRRSTLANRAIAASAALALGGGGLLAANIYASAGEENSQQNAQTTAAGQMATIACPDVGQKLSDVPDGARQGVDEELAKMDSQITEAYARLNSTRDAAAKDPGFVQNSILGPLKSKRTAALDRINTNVQRAGGNAQDLQSLAECEGQPADQAQTAAGEGQEGQDQNQDGQDQNQDGQDQGGQDQGQDQGGQDQGQVGDNGNGAAGPVAGDFIDINQVQPNNDPAGNAANGLAADGEGGSQGTFTSECGTNANNLFNSDNLIAAPGVDNGAHHTHDYVGNQANDAFASDEDLANGDTSCQNQADKSTYYWPVIRQQDGNDEFDANDGGGGADGNVGTILEPAEAEIKFVGNKQSDVVAMPKFLRIITGDAKSNTNGVGNENASWSCTGFEDRQISDKYPICPEGSQVVRTANFQSCWDGQNIDSANHRDHMSFVQEDGSCKEGFQAIPQLQIRLVYDAQAPVIENGQVQNPFAVDSFPEELHKPITDHNDFINVFDEQEMNKVVDCINSGQQCQ
ncbi:DUF1996 domain-containing protein [Streptomyces montanus]|uniref:DUF1996 domain-containing protein n=1 Tax=Streptomyces montanus TaxID=2580423 RepID=A0A5R9FQI9_9ACTN|nr:DUF1996 domain-containing protein [Streptomyces montanus]TLS42814.1 DUF1996 domain-containing protein [Streptomyces montanus]